MKKTELTPSITAVIIARNESAMILTALKTVRWCDHVLVIDNGSTDNSAELAETAGAKVISFKSDSFARVREEAIKHVTTKWILYLDADERITPTLAKEIAVHTETSAANAFSILRKNYFFGHPVTYGGWQEDVVTRVFKVSQLKEWVGDIHESPNFNGEAELLNSSLVHLTHRSVTDNLKKSAEWTQKEATAFIEANIAPVTFKTILRKGLMEFWRRAIRDKGYKDGMVGLLESLTQAINRMWIYMQIWELQQEPSIPERYKYLEDEIQKKWKKDS